MYCFAATTIGIGIRMVSELGKRSIQIEPSYKMFYSSVSMCIQVNYFVWYLRVFGRDKMIWERYEAGYV